MRINFEYIKFIVCMGLLLFGFYLWEIEDKSIYLVIALIGFYGMPKPKLFKE